MASPHEFYDELASSYHLLFDDWWTAARHHGEVVAALLSTRGVPRGRILDVSCGIGTQALSLAELGYQVTGVDISGESIARARHEARVRRLDVDLEVGDMRDLGGHRNGTFDAVISCDNAVPHLLTDADLSRALASMQACLRPGGTLLVSVRDYAVLRQARPGGVPISVHGEPGSRHGSGQGWRWSGDGEYVDIELFTLVEDAPGSWTAASTSTRYRALTRATLGEALATSGYQWIEWLEPEESGYYQPVMLARRPEQRD